MIVTESRRSRHLVIRLQRDEELPGALQRALDEAEARSGWLAGLGAVDAAEIAVLDPLGGPARVRRIEGRCNVVALAGNVATRDGALSVRLTVTLARETDLGNELCGGELLWARAHALELCVTAFDDAELARIDDPRTGLTALAAGAARIVPSGNRAAGTAPPSEPPRPAPAPEPARAAPAPIEAPVEEPRAVAFHVEPPPREEPRVAARPEPPRSAQPVEVAREPARPDSTREPLRADVPRSPSPQTSADLQLPPPVRLRRPQVDTTEVYPEVGDRATHFHFGECTIIASDGERIRLRQERDGRVREVSLEMLRIEPPTTDPTTGQRTFLLSRKR
jgi:predicted DNA-binding protein with PD1-like motif